MCITVSNILRTATLDIHSQHSQELRKTMKEDHIDDHVCVCRAPDICPKTVVVALDEQSNWQAETLWKILADVCRGSGLCLRCGVRPQGKKVS